MQAIFKNKASWPCCTYSFHLVQSKQRRGTGCAKMTNFGLLVSHPTIGWVKNVTDHKTRKSVLFPCYKQQTNNFWSSYNQNLWIDFLHPLQQIPCYCRSRLGCTTHFEIESHILDKNNTCSTHNTKAWKCLILFSSQVTECKFQTNQIPRNTFSVPT